MKKEPSRLFPKPHLQSLSEKQTEREATVGAKVTKETKHTSDEISVRWGSKGSDFTAQHKIKSTACLLSVGKAEYRTENNGSAESLFLTKRQTKEAT